MDTQSGNYNTDDTRPDAATIELDTQSYTQKGADTDAGQQVADKAAQMAEQAKGAVGDTVSKVRDQAVSQIDVQKSRATDAISSVASAVRQTGEQLRQQDQAAIAQYADTAADQIERFSTYLNNRDFNDLTIEVERFARRQPAIFLGGALMAGILVSRFLKSSGQQAHAGSQGSYRYSNDGGYSNYGGYGNDAGVTGYSDYTRGSAYEDADYGSSSRQPNYSTAARVPTSIEFSSGTQEQDSTGSSTGKQHGGKQGSSGSFADSGDSPSQEVS